MRRALAILAAACALGLAAPAAAADFSFTGTFNQDDDVQLFNFTVGASSDITLRTWSYAGGVNAAGQTIARGGFDPILALFDSAGGIVGQNDDGGCSRVATDISGQCWDTFFTATLAAGAYTVSVMQFNNIAIGPNLSNGFLRAGQGNFTPTFPFCTAASQPAFEDISGTAACGRTNAWAFDILNVEQAAISGGGAIPEPSTWAMLLAGFGAVGYALRRRKATDGASPIASDAGMSPRAVCRSNA